MDTAGGVRVENTGQHCCNEQVRNRGAWGGTRKEGGGEGVSEVGGRGVGNWKFVDAVRALVKVAEVTLACCGVWGIGAVLLLPPPVRLRMSTKSITQEVRVPSMSRAIPS